MTEIGSKLHVFLPTRVALRCLSNTWRCQESGTHIMFPASLLKDLQKKLRCSFQKDLGHTQNLCTDKTSFWSVQQQHSLRPPKSVSENIATRRGWLCGLHCVWWRALFEFGMNYEESYHECGASSLRDETLCDNTTLGYIRMISDLQLTYVPWLFTI